MTFTVWYKLLASQNFAVAPSRLGLATTVTFASLLNSLARGVERVIYERRARTIRVKRQPIFLIGHWRTGTTFLHELLAMDDQFSVPNTYQCLQPSHFLFTESWVKPAAAFLIPNKRPMDNMAAGLDLPQEDEFALANLGVPSPYLFWAFPNRPNWCDDYLDMEGLDDITVRRWQEALRWFVTRLTIADPRRLVLKSPPHTARIKMILDVFPAAKFIHLVRDPQKVIPSTIYTWRQLSAALTLQGKLNKELEDHALASFTRMYRAFEDQRHLLADDRFCELRFEDLMAEPLSTMEGVYKHLSLGDFSHVQEAFANYLTEKKSHQRFRHEVPEPLKARIEETCGDYMRTYGYWTR